MNWRTNIAARPNSAAAPRPSKDPRVCTAPNRSADGTARTRGQRECLIPAAPTARMMTKMRVCDATFGLPNVPVAPAVAIVSSDHGRISYSKNLSNP